jgi:hypothetical protein
MTKLAQRHNVWTSYWASYPALRIYDEIKKHHENFIMDQRISCSASLDLRDHIAVDTIEPEWMLLITLAQSLAIRTWRRRVSLVRLIPYRHAAIVSKDSGPVAYDIKAQGCRPTTRSFGWWLMAGADLF